MNDTYPLATYSICYRTLHGYLQDCSTQFDLFYGMGDVFSWWVPKVFVGPPKR